MASTQPSHAHDGAEQADEPGAAWRTPVLCNLVYCSRASADVAEADVERIIAAARRHNPALGITGMLVFGSGVFFQWLEGPRSGLSQLMALLHADPRHHDMVVLNEVEEPRERLFPDWDMERVDAEAIREVLVDARDHAADARNVAALDALLADLDTGRLAALATA